VFAVESVLREQLDPHKINLASLGNVVPHLHWHVIPRYTDDPHFPQPIWSNAQREINARDRDASTGTLAEAIAAALE
jgi:diadenosine tetraphosphate (Ap4A) HIT family hydrolase